MSRRMYRLTQGEPVCQDECTGSRKASQCVKTNVPAVTCSARQVKRGRAAGSQRGDEAARQSGRAAERQREAGQRDSGSKTERQRRERSSAAAGQRGGAAKSGARQRGAGGERAVPCA